MTTPSPLSDSAPHWYLLGAGNMGTLAARYLLQAGHGVTVVRAQPGPPLVKQLQLPQGNSHNISLPVAGPEQLPPRIYHLLVACKTPYSREALQRVHGALDSQTLVLRFQNGLGALDGLLPPGSPLLEAVSTSAVKGQHPSYQIVAENHTWLGGLPQPPDWFTDLQGHWPQLHWQTDMRPRQWHKLVVNAVINPLTALHDVANGAINQDPALREQATRLCAEADALLRRLDPNWPGDSLPDVLAVARATAANTSSMRADRQRGATTEIDAINGWLLRQADALGMDLPAHRDLVHHLT